MTIEKQNIAIYKLLGYKPVKAWRFYTDKERQNGYLSLRSKDEAMQRIAIDKINWPYTEYPQDYEFSEPEEYEDWSCCPHIDIDMLNVIEKQIIESGESSFYWFFLRQILDFSDTESDWTCNDFIKAAAAKISVRKEAILKTFKLWED